MLEFMWEKKTGICGNIIPFRFLHVQNFVSVSNTFTTPKESWENWRLGFGV
jgi:hypothetical protein